MRTWLRAAWGLPALGGTTLALAATGQETLALGLLAATAAGALWHYAWRTRGLLAPTPVPTPPSGEEAPLDVSRVRTAAALTDGHRLIAVNETLARLLGAHLPASPSPTALPPGLDRGELLALLERMHAGHDCPPRMLRWAADATLVAAPVGEGVLLLLFGVPDAREARESDTDLAPLLDHIEQAVFQTDTEGALRRLSAGWRRLTGFDPRTSLGQSLVSHLHPSDRTDAQRTLALVEGGRKDHLLMEVRLLAGDGTLHWVELRAGSIAGEDGSPLGAAGTITEITRRKQLEESLRSSRRRLNTLLANVPGMVYRGRHDRNWTMEYVSDGCLDLTGYEPHDIVDNGRVSFGELIHPEDREFVWALVDTQLAQTQSFQLSYRIVDAAGEVKWVWEQGRGIFSSSGELLALEGFITDVSARRGAEEQAKRRLWFDARTGLASRTIFDDRLSFVLEHGRLVGYRCAVLWVDLDNFGEINARFGRDFGDRVLAGMARRFKLVQGPGSTVARVGGDEFAVLVTDFRLAGAVAPLPAGRELTEAAGRLADSLARALREPLRLDGRELPVSASIGVAVRAETHVSGDALLAAARRAAFEARAAGTGQWRLVDD